MSFSTRTRAPRATRSQAKRGKPATGRHLARPGLEALEDRTLLSSAYQNLVADLSPATNPLTSALTAAETGLNSISSTVSSAASSLPFFNGASGVGTLVTNGLAQVGNFLTTISTDLQNLTTNDPTPTDQQVATKLYNALDPSASNPQKNILGDTGNGEVNTQDKTQDYVVITHPLGDSDGSKSVEIELYLTSTISGSLSLGSGNFFELPGLPVHLTANAGLTYSLNFRYELAFGYDPSFVGNKNGFFIDTSKLLSDFGKTAGGTALPDHQMSVSATASLSPGSNIGASLGTFQAYLTDNSSKPTMASLALDVDGLDLTPITDVKPSLEGSIGIHLIASAGLGPYQNNEFQYVSVGVGVNVDWTFSTSGQDQGPSVSFDDIKLELGPAISQFVMPIITDIQDVLLPVQPVLKVLTEPIPGLSDVSHLVGQGNVTLLGLIEEAANIGAFGPGFDPLVQLIGTIVPLLNDLDAFQASGNTLFLDLGDLSLPGSDTQGLLDNNYASNFVNGTAPSIPLAFDQASTNPVITDMQDVISNVPGLASSAESAEKAAMDALNNFLGSGNGISINFPILDNPTSVLFPLLLNQGNADLFTFNANLNVNASLDEALPISIFGLNLRLEGQLNFSFHVDAGYDTQGIRDMISDDFAPSKLLPDFVEGFYVSTGNIVTLDGSFSVQAGESLGPFSAGVQGGIYTGDGVHSASIDQPLPLTVSLTGGSNGKVRISDFNSSSAPAFVAQGEVDAGLDIYVKVGFSILGHFVGVEHDFDIATVQLLSFGSNSSLQSHPPVLATWVNQSTGELKLANLGASETFTVSPDQDDPTGALGDVDVSAMGFTVEFKGVKQIDAGTSSGKNSITIEPGVRANAVLIGGSGSDALTYDGAGDATLFAGTGSDQLTFAGSAGSATLVGGSGTDTLNAARGNDLVTAGSGAAQLLAGTGADTLQGGAGATDAFFWEVGDGPSVIRGDSASCSLEVEGTPAAEQFTLNAASSGVSIQVPAPPTSSSHSPLSLAVTGVPQIDFEGEGGGDTFNINDVADAGVATVGINLSEAGHDSGGGDKLVINGYPDFANTVSIATKEVVAAVTPNNQAIPGLLTEVNVAPTQTPVGALEVQFTVYAAIPDKTDTLTVNTGASADTVMVQGTQPDVTLPKPGGQVFVNTGAGDDAITVGGPENLDDFFGPLTIDAGAGKNQITFDESGSNIKDTAVLSATQLIRYTQTQPAQQIGALPITEIGYPLIVNFKASDGGDFAAGVFFDGGNA